MRHSALVTFALFLGFVAVAPAQVRLENKLNEGKTYTSTTSITIDQTLNLGGAEIPTNNEVKTTSKTTVGKRDDSGNVRVQEKVESLQVNLNAAGQQYIFDSANPDKAGNSMLEILRDVHKAMIKNVSTTVYNKDNRIEAVEIDQNLIGSLPVATQEIVKSQLNPENLKQTANQELERLPSDTVKMGDTWVRTENTNLGSGQQMTFQTEYTYAGTVTKDGKSYDKITSKPLSVEFNLQPDSPLPLKVKGSELKPGATESTYMFDRELGQFVESNTSLEVTGDITFEVMGNEVPSKLVLKIKTVSTTKVGT